MLDLPCLSSYRDAWWRILSCPVVGWLRNFSNSRIRRLFPFFTCPQLSTIPHIHLENSDSPIEEQVESQIQSLESGMPPGSGPSRLTKMQAIRTLRQIATVIRSPAFGKS